LEGRIDWDLPDWREGRVRFDVYFGRPYAMLSVRSKFKRKTMERTKKEYSGEKAA